MKITGIGCLHGHYPDLPGGDLLIITGDLTRRDTPEEFIHFKNWIVSISRHYRKVIMIAGNHDNLIKQRIMMGPKETWNCGILAYLEDSGTEFEGLKIWGSPWTKTFKGMNPNCKAFTVDTDEDLAEKWSLIPKDTDILITHSPPYEILDKNKFGEHCGSKSLKNKIIEINPRIHIFSHIHEGYGKITMISDFTEDEEILTNPYKIICYNCSIMNEKYMPVNKPFLFKIKSMTMKITEMDIPKLIYRPENQSAELVDQNCTMGIKYIMPDEQKYKDDMIKKNWTISIDDDDKIIYELIEDGKVLYCNEYNKKSKSNIFYDPNVIINLVSSIKNE